MVTLGDMESLEGPWVGVGSNNNLVLDLSIGFTCVLFVTIHLAISLKFVYFLYVASS